MTFALAEHVEVTACVGPTKIVRVNGVRTEVLGHQALGLVGFRAHCDCGYLGRTRGNWFTANMDRQIHRGQR